VAVNRKQPPIQLVAIAALVLALTFISAPVFAQDVVGEVTKVTGAAKLDRGGNKVDLAPSMPIQVRDTLTTAAKAELTVTFRDGSQLILSESSSYTIDQYAMTAAIRRQATIDLWAGHIRALVTGTGIIPDFEVHTPNATAAVRGTEFETAFIEGRPCPEDRSCMRYTTVGVFHGVVAVANILNPAQAVEVTEGYETTVACESPATSPAPLGMGEMGAPGYH
jgi:hypothetical protein